MKQKIIFAAVMIVACIWVMVLLVTLAASCSAVYVPEVHGYDPGVDYMARMVEATEDGSPWALAGPAHAVYVPPDIAQVNA